MYKVTIINDDVETTIHSSYVDGIKLETGTIKKEINKIDSFNMSFFLNNPAVNKLKPFKTIVNVLNTRTNRLEFEGRVLNPNNDMDDDGLHSYDYECEGELGYLHDSQQQHLEYRGTPKQLLTKILDYHNSQVEEYKRFLPGVVEVTTSTDDVYFYLSAEKSTFEEIDDKVLDRIGGELHIRKENGKRYLDVLERIGEKKSTEIRIAKNLRSISQSIDPTEIITRLTPLGERVESEDEGATDASEARLTIESVNNNKPYIDRPDLIAEFGIQGGSKTWDDITLASRLLSTAQKWINNQKVALYQYDISALDLFLIGLEIDDFYVGNSHDVINPIMNIDENLRIIGKTTDINNPQDASLKIGDKFKSLNEYQADANKSAVKIVDLENTVDRQSKTISTIRIEMNNVETNLSDLQQVVANTDLEELPGAIAALEQSIIDLNDALEGMPIYDVVTQTTNGLMSYIDKIKLDGLEKYDIATELKRGLMSSTDKAKLNKITVSKNINLDDILTRLETLEGV